MTATNSKTFSGGQCQCGNIRYRLHGEPLTLYACHCLDCQKQSSSAFGLSMWVAVKDFELLTGELKFWSTTADSGDEKRCAFCPECGTRIYHGFDDGSSRISIKAGTLDDTSKLDPVAHIWTRRAHRWLHLGSSGVQCHDTEPDSFDGILAAWAERRSQS